MALRAILFDFNGIIINDEPIHERLLQQILLEENLNIESIELQAFCLGRSDRACLENLLEARGRIVTETYLNQLIERKAKSYQAELEALPELPLYPDTKAFIRRLSETELKLGIVSGAIRSEVELILQRAELKRYFSVIVTSDEVATSKPEPEGYLLAVQLLNETYPDLNLKPEECLGIEDSLAGVKAAQQAGISVVGVAHTYPFHMLQRLANWCVDSLADLELDRVLKHY
ncbi:MAG: HAD family phosphatase [Oscillatoriales cyanobacterium RM2_1_1]|nr:HAD family phosphatase [Oscillatoriales cyanobacterium RM2_1_1]